MARLRSSARWQNSNGPRRRKNLARKCKGTPWTGCGKTGACVQHGGRAALQGRESRSESVTALQAAEKPRICVLCVLCGLQCLAYQGTAFNHTVLPRNENRLFSRCGNDLSRRPVFPQPVSVVP